MLRQHVFQRIAAGHHSVKQVITVLTDHGAEGFAFLAHQADRHTGQAVFIRVPDAIVVPVRKDAAPDSAGLDQTDIHPGPFFAQAQGEVFRITFSVRLVQDHVALAQAGKGIFLQLREAAVVHAQAVRSGRDVLQFKLTLHAGFVLSHDVSVRIQELHHVAGHNLFLPVHVAGEVVVHIDITGNSCRVDNADVHLPLLGVGQFKVLPEVFPSARPGREMVAQRIADGPGKVTSVVRQERPHLIGVGAQAAQHIGAVLTGIGHGRFLILGLLDRGDLNAGHGQIALVINAVIVGILETDTGDDAGPGKADILLFLAFLIIQVKPVKIAGHAVFGNHSLPAVTGSRPGEHHAFRRIRPQLIGGRLYPVDIEVTVLVGNSLIMQAVLFAVQLDLDARQHRFTV